MACVPFFVPTSFCFQKHLVSQPGTEAGGLMHEVWQSCNIVGDVARNFRNEHVA